jgi:uncharacterized protein
MGQPMLDKQTLLNQLRFLRPELENQFGIELVGLCGSQATGLARMDSDIDLAVRKVRQIHLGHVVDAKDWLEAKFNRQVDLVFLDALPSYKRTLFERDLLVLA